MEAVTHSAFDPGRLGLAVEAATRTALDPRKLGLAVEAVTHSAFDPGKLGLAVEAATRSAFDPGKLGLAVEAATRSALESMERALRSPLLSQPLMAEIGVAASWSREFDRRAMHGMVRVEQWPQEPFVVSRSRSGSQVDIVSVRTPELVNDPIIELIAWMGEKCRGIPGYMDSAKEKFIDLCVIAFILLIRLLGKVSLEDATNAVRAVVSELVQRDW